MTLSAPSVPSSIRPFCTKSQANQCNDRLTGYWFNLHNYYIAEEYRQSTKQSKLGIKNIPIALFTSTMNSNSCNLDYRWCWTGATCGFIELRRMSNRRKTHCNWGLFSVFWTWLVQQLARHSRFDSSSLRHPFRWSENFWHTFCVKQLTSEFNLVFLLVAREFPEHTGKTISRLHRTCARGGIEPWSGAVLTTLPVLQEKMTPYIQWI